MSAQAHDIEYNAPQSVTTISANARVDYILRFSKHAVLVVDQDANVYSQVASKPSTSSQTTVAASDGKGRYHTVQAGDTLWDIAKKNGLSVGKLKELNNISNDYRLKIGSKLKIG